MKNNLLSSYVFDRLKSVEQHLYAFGIARDPECLHRLRVEIKRIKAACYFAENVYHEKYSMGKLIRLFKKAGKIREVQICIHLLGLFPHPPKRLIELLKRKERILIQLFNADDARYFSCIRSFRKNICLPEKLVNKKTIKKYFDEEKGIAIHTLQNKDREGMHQYRIKIKQMMYVYNLLPGKLQKYIELDKVMTGKFQEKLGDWHDIYSAIDIVSHEQLSESTAEYILELKNEESKQFNALLITLKDYFK